MKKHANLSIFVPHAGCTHMCSFCDQRAISQTAQAPRVAEVTQMCDKYLPQDGKNTEIAFFGGSFTAIDEKTRLELLDTAFMFVRQKRAAGIRISTRPDAISQSILNELRLYGVTSIELGAQSMDDKVLCKNMRGHSAQHVINAARLIKHNGFSLGLQMMPGLYGARNYMREATETMIELLKLNADTMRIYPAVVLQGTHLAKLYSNGEYTPLGIDEAVKICAPLILMCERAGVKVIRAGLAADAELEKAVISGPYHPAFRELCEALIFYDIINTRLSTYACGNYIVSVARGRRSAAGGQKNSNIAAFAQKGFNIIIEQDNNLQGREVQIRIC